MSRCDICKNKECGIRRVLSARKSLLSDSNKKTEKFEGSRVAMVGWDDNGDGDYYKLLCNSITKQYLLAGFIIRLSGY